MSIGRSFMDGTDDKGTDSTSELVPTSFFLEYISITTVILQ